MAGTSLFIYMLKWERFVVKKNNILIYNSVVFVTSKLSDCFFQKIWIMRSDIKQVSVNQEHTLNFSMTFDDFGLYCVQSDEA